jgi:RNA polymerase sigma-70 factor (ECF subfamily)
MDSALLGRIAALHQESFGWALACADRDRREAEDVLQAVYLKVLEGRARFGGGSSLKTWLFAVIRRTAAEYRRRARLRRLRLVPLEHDAPSGEPAPDETAEGAERRERLAHALGRLPRRQREVLVLVFYHEHSVEEAARVLGIGTGSARTHYARGKARLRELLTDMEDG